MEAAWKGILTEAERLSDVHLKVKENLCCGEIQQIKTWQKDNFHKVSGSTYFIIRIRLVADFSILLVSIPISDDDADKRTQRNGRSIQEGTKTVGKTFSKSGKDQS